MDGARLLNAVVASGVSAGDFARPFDSLWIDLSKGLGCPVGAVLAGSREFIEEAWRLKQRSGGAMRQAGIIAAAGVYALEHNVERSEEHTSELQSLMRISYAVFCLKKKTKNNTTTASRTRTTYAPNNNDSMPDEFH